MQEADREIQELLHWMREDGASSDEEGDMLMALAQQAGPTPKSQNPGSSQKVLPPLCCSKQHWLRAVTPLFQPFEQLEHRAACLQCKAPDCHELLHSLQRSCKLLCMHCVSYVFMPPFASPVELHSDRGLVTLLLASCHIAGYTVWLHCQAASITKHVVLTERSL